MLRITSHDNVAVATTDIKAGMILSSGTNRLTFIEDIPKGHKVALQNIKANENIIKYGFPIGHASHNILAGSLVHEHNITTNLGEILEYEYTQDTVATLKAQSPIKTFKGYKRRDGRVGVRNEIFIIPTVGCVNKIAQLLAEKSKETIKEYQNVEGIYELTHPYGCSQLGEDHKTTQQILANIVNHPNAGAVLVLGLGCENNNITEFKQVLGEYDERRVRFLIAQDVSDEITEGLNIIKDLLKYANGFSREDCLVSDLVIGLKCGGSDGFSGITANPLLGLFSDKLIAQGGSTVLTEVPEMFGAETILMNRAKNQEVFAKIVKMINNFKEYYIFHNQPIYENPSPGNKKGGISTLEDKSLGCTQKGGRSEVVDVVDYGGIIRSNGLNLLAGPGNDIVSCTAMAAAGCQMILFTTGRGTPLGTIVPTIKVATNSDIYTKKTTWFDFDAGKILTNLSIEDVGSDFEEFILAIAAGQKTKAELMGFREITMFKTGVTL